MSGMKEHIPGTAEHRATHPGGTATGTSTGTGMMGEVKSHVPGTAEYRATHGTGTGHHTGMGTTAEHHAGTGHHHHTGMAAGMGAGVGERYGEGYEKTAYPYGATGATGGTAYEGTGAVPTAGLGGMGEGTTTAAGYAPQVAPSVPVEGEPYPVEPTTGAMGTTTGATYETYEGEGRGAYAGGPGTAGTAQRAGRTVETATGEVHEHRTGTGAAMDQAWQKAKEVMPGTKEHAASRGTTSGHRGGV